DGVKTVKCLDCNSSTVTKVAPALFVCKGYSTPIDSDDEMSISFDINHDALKEYELVTGYTLSYGIFAAAKTVLGDNDVLSSNGEATQGVIKAEVNTDNLVSFELRLSGFVTETQKSASLVLGAYVGVTDKESNTQYFFIQHANSTENAKYHFISFNDVVNSPKN
ncbi:MAG: hypothetical protein IKA02_06310, partial [Clostridia bacterium]|nr:hypothetical protein [Clostridia bacterium]